MKTLKISLLLIIIFILFGCNNVENIQKQIPDKENYVATMDLFTSDGSYNKQFLIMNLGHSFLRIINETANDLLVGKYMMKPYEEITIGLWSITIEFGVWYNLDAYFSYDNSRYSDRVALRTTLTMDDINKINEFINKDPKWTPLYNCSQFCLDIWNMTNENDKFDIGIATPGKLKKVFKEYMILNDITIINNDNIGYFKDGKFILCEIQ